ncbi:GFA family protein [Agrobacterium sp. rho-13.3]|uniref:GFA family protein n=1 Tax=Agrobacterium sp. rho-13.3 TaxID=3072980 RepID=UPI002A116A7A|nr:GFA family protein [Agrobacterium sp. rho-13.3]MDX8310398.1 GFA family protein [Agrobacterium sp. rho-13.3]
MHITGQCHCGHVTFEADANPDRVGICHCTDCQRLTGSPFRVTVMVERSALKLGDNQPKVYRKTADNGRGRKQHFCPQCGSPLFTSGEGDDANEWGIRWGSINERDALVPKAQIWTRSAVDWVSDIERLPGYEKDHEE